MAILKRQRKWCYVVRICHPDEIFTLVSEIGARIGNR